ncbi:hypothetical protein [Gilvibacter sediminis]|uniref:hypothetical protein n=1 Tax=Gilvibacter sediminis TaxID=379071 RepID=UPI0023509B8D|nr:hypothetical protein [Gilvibacter sediminis]MDC7997863.1 hypothetical protein [Gilvibacter sediminis]
MKPHIYILLLLSVFSLSCQRDYKDVVVYGKVTDWVTKKPITGLEIMVENWAYDDSPDQSYALQEQFRVTTNSEGYYEKQLNKSHFVVLYIKDSIYGEKLETLYVSANGDEKNIELIPQ